MVSITGASATWFCTGANASPNNYHLYYNIWPWQRGVFSMSQWRTALRLWRSMLLVKVMMLNDTITILGSALGGTDGVNDLTLTVATLSSDSLESFGSTVSGNTIDTARFSGGIAMLSSDDF
jgi:hypothetical protein